MPINHEKNYQGFSLIELMLSLFLGSLLLAMVIGLYVTGVSNGAKNAKYSRLRTDLQSMLSIMTTDIRRAGYGGVDFLVKDDDGKNISVKITTLLGKHCIIYSYDHKLDQQLNTDDKMGFCYDQALKKVQFVTNVGADKTWDEIWSCVTDGGTWSTCIVGGNWVNLSDPDFISITALTFTQSTSSSATATLRNITIKLTGELKANSDYTYSATSTIQVRNVELQ
jgi:prepilin-type N-terminal cleavage/methylation domain-containing protein